MAMGYREIGYQYFNAGQYDLAIANLEKVRPIDVDVLNDIGRAYLMKGQYAQAFGYVIQTPQLLGITGGGIPGNYRKKSKA